MKTAQRRTARSPKPKGPPKPGRAGLEALQLKAAMETYETLSAAFPDLKVGLAHGRMKSEEKSAVMGAFSAMKCSCWWPPR